MTAEIDGKPEEIVWHWLRPHLERDAVIVAAPGLDLQKVASRLAADDAATVGRWIAEGELGKPTAEQLEGWNAEPAKRFRMTIVQPWILIQEPPPEGDPHG
ncbi:MAG: DUF2288 domain-containing protein [Desulfuromonadales bacterium]|nr:DUF2288 domain-containing protein [Desulfuromonadales bacterium]